MSRAIEAAKAFFASAIPAKLSASSISGSSWVSSQVRTSPIERPDVAAANSIGARSLAAVEYQKSASVRPRLLTEAPSASQAAVFRAPAQLSQLTSGVQPALSSPVLPA